MKLLPGYGWQPGEREQVEVEMMEREQRIATEAAEPAATWQPPAEPVTKAAPMPERHAAPATAATPTASWRDYIERRLRRQSEDMLAAIGEVMAEERAEREKVERELRAEVATLKTEIAEL